MSSSHFASRFRKDLTTEMIRTKLAHRKSLSQKQNRHKEYEQNRRFGLKDVNIPTLEGRILVELDETSQELALEKANIKPRSVKTVLCDQRKQMLQKYKEEKQLQKLKEQREKAKRGVFKVGLYRPDTPGFLSSNQNAMKAGPQKTISSSVRITRSKAKDLMEQTKTYNGSDVRAVRPGQRQTSEKKVLDREEKVVQPVAPTSVRMTRSASQAAKQVAGAVSSSTARKPFSRATGGNNSFLISVYNKCYVAQVSLELLGSSSLPTLASQTARITPSLNLVLLMQCFCLVTMVISFPFYLDNELARQALNKGRPIPQTETTPKKDISHKVDHEGNMLDSQTIKSTTNVLDPDGVSLKMENSPKTNTVKIKGKNSFAPKDFMFQPLEGLKTYQVTPMTPRSADAFLTPSYTWTPWKTEDDKTQEATKDILALKCKMSATEIVQQDSNKLQHPLGSLTVWNEEQVLNYNKATTKKSNGLPRTEVPSLEMKEGQIAQLQHDVPYFRNILQSETEKLTSSCLQWEKKLELDIPDDAKDLIRTAVGQTRLLMKERFKQFEGLVNDCEYKRGEKETTCTDLDGFWDMISFQIEDVNQKFNNLTRLEESGWQNNSNASKKVFRKKVISGLVNKPKQDDGGRIAARNRLAAIKSAMREKMKQGEHAEAAASVMPKEVDKIVFDAGFFRVESPIKSFSGLSISFECPSQRLRTPKSVSTAVSQSRGAVSLLRQTASSESPSTKNEHKDTKTWFANIPESGISTGEDAQCPGSQDLIEMKPNIVSQEKKTKLPQSVLFDNNSLTTECHLVDSTGLNCSNPFTQPEGRHREHSRHVSLGGDLISFSPLRPPCGEQPEEF
ncbi:disks large-associated protein 5 [Nycticebus coucang]|uniref:disks large-associated protein 5 n=1 Tax=Nycticebus coucang TaxID=9470 RepID=UPI00234CA9EA|nr:disks large-associated protein 5 [Nycticebus coucang]